MANIYTIGHSNRQMPELAEILHSYGIGAVADVRSNPFSKVHPHFNRDVLAASLEMEEIEYVFMGKELGGRSSDPHCYVNGQMSYPKLAQTELFKRGLERIQSGCRKGYTIALLCTEKDPLMCHRGLLISRQLSGEGEKVTHILDRQQVESQEESLARLLEITDLQSLHMFKTEEEVIEMAYDIQSARVAYTQEDDLSEVPE